MNYYPFHIGDYASATRHLTWDEDAAYRRLLDVYYTTEKPLPLELRQVFRLVIAGTEPQREAVQTVLNEFFDRTEDGWVNPRADTEIAQMRKKQEASEERDEHEKTRQQKHRERRSAMFAQLAEVGVYPAWNAKTSELERLIAENCDALVTAPVTRPVTAPDTPSTIENGDKPVTKTVTAPVTPDTDEASHLRRPATAIPTPTPTPTPISIKEAIASLPSAEPPPCPHQRLLELFAEQVPELPQPRRELWEGGKGADAMRQRWRWLLTAKRGKTGQRYATTTEEGLDWFRRFFGQVAASDFLTGRNGAWRSCDLAWLMKLENFTKVVQGNYANGERATA